MFTIRAKPTNSTTTPINTPSTNTATTSTTTTATTHTVTNHAAFSLAIRKRKKSEAQVKEAPIPIIMTSSTGGSSPRRKTSVVGETSVTSPLHSPKLQFVVEKKKIQNTFSVSTYARIITNYEAHSEDELTVAEGDLVKILEEGRDDWTVVSKIASAITKAFYGAVPSSLGKSGFLSSVMESTSPPAFSSYLSDSSTHSLHQKSVLVGMIPQRCYEVIDKKEVIQLLSQNDSQEPHSSLESPRTSSTASTAAVSLPKLAMTNSMKELKKSMDSSPISTILSPKQFSPPQHSFFGGTSPPKSTMNIPPAKQVEVPNKLKKSLSESSLSAGTSLINPQQAESPPVLFGGVTYYDDFDYNSDVSSEDESGFISSKPAPVVTATHHSIAAHLILSQCRAFLCKTRFDKYIRQSKDLAAQRKRKVVITEIVETERTYVNLLNKCISMYKQPIQQQKLLDDKMIDAIFLNLEAIKTLHEFFLKDLEKEYETTRHVGKVASKYMESLKVYTEYINRYSDAMETLNTIQSSKSYSKFRVFVGTISEESYGFSLNLEALLVLPIQRVPRYKMLLNELLHSTASDHVDFDAISKSYNRVSEIATFINEEKRKADNNITVQELAAGLKGSFKSFNASNKQLLHTMNIKVHHEEVKQAISGEGIRYEECKAFIFEDMIVLSALHSPKASPRGTFEKVKSLLFNASDEGDDIVAGNGSSLFRKKTVMNSLNASNGGLDDPNKTKIIFFPFAQFYSLDQMIDDIFGGEVEDWEFGANPMYSHDYGVSTKQIMLEYLEDGIIHRAILGFESNADCTVCKDVLQKAFHLYSAKRGQEKNITEYVKRKLIYEGDKVSASKNIHDLEQEKWAVEKQLNHSTAELKKLYHKLHKLQKKIGTEQSQFMKLNEQMDSLTDQMQNQKTVYETAVHEILLRDQTLIELAGNNETYQRVLGKRKSGLKNAGEEYINSSSLLIPGFTLNPIRKSASNNSFQ